MPKTVLKKYSADSICLPFVERRLNNLERMLHINSRSEHPNTLDVIVCRVIFTCIIEILEDIKNYREAKGLSKKHQLSVLILLMQSVVTKYYSSQSLVTTIKVLNDTHGLTSNTEVKECGSLKKSKIEIENIQTSSGEHACETVNHIDDNI